ncbi:hypothetical protein [Gordonia sputi]
MNADFPILDADRSNEDSEIGRVVLANLDSLEPYIPMTDSWVTLPVRIAYIQTSHVVLEIGPYTLDFTDVGRVKDAIDRFYHAGGVAE